MAREDVIELNLSRRLINLVSSLTPTLEGLLLMTVINGKTGHVHIRHHASQAAEVAAFIADLESRYPGELSRLG